MEAQASAVERASCERGRDQPYPSDEKVMEIVDFEKLVNLRDVLEDCRESRGADGRGFDHVAEGRHADTKVSESRRRPNNRVRCG